MPLRIDVLQIDDYNREEMARHSVTGEEVIEVFEGGYRILVNGGEGNAPYKLVGLTDGGRPLSIPIEETTNPYVWRPATARRANKDELAKIKGKLR